MTRRYDTGDGDVCPLNPDHGHMTYLSGTKSQWCPDQSHDGKPNGGVQTRSFWSQGYRSFEAEVAQIATPSKMTAEERLASGKPLPTGKALKAAMKGAQ